MNLDSCDYGKTSSDQSAIRQSKATGQAKACIAFIIDHYRHSSFVSWINFVWRHKVEAYEPIKYELDGATRRFSDRAWGDAKGRA